MAQNKTVAVLLGSLRADSFNRKLALAAAEAAPDGVQLAIIDELADLPFYNEDIDTAEALAAGGWPVEAVRAAVASADALLVVTPEYNGTIPAVVKNAIDWLSRPYGASALSGKPAAVIGAAVGRFGGKWAHDETRKAIGIAGAQVIEDAQYSLAIADLAGAAPAEHPVSVVAVTDVVRALVGASADQVS